MDKQTEKEFIELLKENNALTVGEEPLPDGTLPFEESINRIDKRIDDIIEEEGLDSETIGAYMKIAGII